MQTVNTALDHGESKDWIDHKFDLQMLLSNNLESDLDGP